MSEIRPEKVRDYVARAVPSPPTTPGSTHLEQVGEMRLKPDQGWMPFTAEQSIEAATTAFHWHARVKMAPFVTAVVDDAYENHRGRLDAKVWGIVPVAHGRGVDVDRGEAERYLAELAWCPLALLRNQELRFRELEADIVRIWVGDEDTYIDLGFDGAGDIETASTTTRSRGGTSEPWAGRFSDYRDFDGIRAPSRAEVWWETAAGRFDYWRGTITSLSWKD